MSAPRLLDRDRDAPYSLPQSTYTTRSWLTSNHLSCFLEDFVSLLKPNPIARQSSRGRAGCWYEPQGLNCLLRTMDAASAIPMKRSQVMRAVPITFETAQGRPGLAEVLPSLRHL